jgi:hypothetical protein
MKEVFGDLWEFDGIIGITTNGFVKRDRTCVMGRGCARQAVVRFPELRRKLASRISAEGNHVFHFPEHGLIIFPVKHNWWEAADLGLIQRSARELLKIIEVKKIKEAVYLPRPGIRQRSAKLGGREENPLANPQVGSIPHRDLQQNRFVETSIQPSGPRSYPGGRVRTQSMDPHR